MIKKQTLTPQEELDKEYMRAYINSFLSPEYDQHIPLVDESYFQHIYGKVGNAKMNKLIKFSPEEEKNQNSKEGKG